MDPWFGTDPKFRICVKPVSTRWTHGSCGGGTCRYNSATGHIGRRFQRNALGTTSKYSTHPERVIFGESIFSLNFQRFFELQNRFWARKWVIFRWVWSNLLKFAWGLRFPHIYPQLLAFYRGFSVCSQTKVCFNHILKPGRMICSGRIVTPSVSWLWFFELVGLAKGLVASDGCLFVVLLWSFFCVSVYSVHFYTIYVSIFFILWVIIYSFWNTFEPLWGS